ncbi:MAG: hypothetical protein ACRDGS_00955 [Chloroflexota bacterium]
MGDMPENESIEIDGDRYVALVSERRWPKFVMLWALRQRDGDSDFPISGGEIESLPRADLSELEQWSNLREEALQAAQEPRLAVPVVIERRSVLDRILRR